ncbi:hypothetical protein ATO10_07717 [Actibacterium atlanticum]|uniref:Uncharacterized protein n=1 Tax=Actibacterium atlanticum TaxID=1461693 RepID=A0A058ZM27_9RHOB|nr:hypothetical protein ATO10_07717 [Actibacterium atlanticum]
MTYAHKITTTAVAVLLALGTTCAAQTQATQNPAAFASENAILDTSIPFAIGAREARQSLRGAFGWPTFQEGLVEGVYFRFDPDGYARFSSTPRLDTDVFEVICRPRTFSCMGRKGPLSLILNTRGQLQLKLDDVASGDTFFVSEGVSEIQVPERILQPLDVQLENLLSTGGELIIRRGENEVNRVSLNGFMPVSAYLRWIVARQDYSVLPRGWPVPNALGDTQNGNMTQVSEWNSPMPQPQYFPSQGAAPGLQTANAAAPAEVAEVKGELKVLRELLLAKNAEQAIPPAAAAPIAPGSMAQPSSNLSEVETHILELQATTDQILADIETLRQAANQLPVHPPAAEQPMTQTAYPNEPSQQARRLEYLMSEIGLDAETALMIMELAETRPQESAQGYMAPEAPVFPKSMGQAVKQDIVSEILAELEAELNTPAVATETPPEAPIATSVQAPSASPEEYQLLSDYFKSAFSGQQ